MKNDILVTVLCTAYNHENYIRAAIDGFLMQTVSFPFEIIIHDDASTDRTPDIIAEYAEKYPEQIRPVLQKENQYKRGIKIYPIFLYPITRGKYIALCKGDDYWTDNKKLQKQVDFMSEHPDCSMCFHSAKIYNIRAQRYEGIMRPYFGTRILPEDMLFYGGGHEVPTASILFLKERIDDIPGFALECPVGDHPLALLLSYRGRIGYMDEVMSVRNLWVPDSWNTRYYKDTDKSKRIEHLRAMQKLLRGYDIYTGGKFGIQINKRIMAGELEIFRIQGKDPYKSSEFLDMLRPFRSSAKLKIWFSCKMPVVSNIYSAIKKMINKRIRIKSYICE